VGTRETPKFTVGTALRVGDDEHLAMFYANASPAIVDFDGDDRLDIIVTTNDRLIFLRNEGTRDRPRLANGIAVKVDGKKGLPYQGLSLVSADRTKANVGDLLLGSAQFIYHAQNIGSPQSPEYSIRGPVLQEKAPLLFLRLRYPTSVIGTATESPIYWSAARKGSLRSSRIARRRRRPVWISTRESS
jgi:hypothetical protein